MASILIIDDDVGVRSFLHAVLEAAGYTVQVAGTGIEGYQLLRRGRIDLVVLDIYMPEHDGLELIPLFRKEFPAMPILAMSGRLTEMEPLRTAHGLGATNTLAKPIGVQPLLDAVHTLVDDA